MVFRFVQLANKQSSISFAVPMIGVNPKITVRIGIFVPPKQRTFPLKERDEIAYPNLDSARTPNSS